MKKLLVLLMALFTLAQVDAQEKNVIRIATDNTDLILQVAPNGRLYQAYLGDKLLNEKDINNFSPYVKGGSDGSVSTRGWEVYPCSGAEDYFEPAFAIQHNDGNMTSIFKYVSSESKKLDNNVTETIISLKDDVYPVEAKLHYVTFAKENVIKAWTEIRHMEKKPVTITQYASNMLYFESPRYVLTEFSGDWAKEVQMSSQDLKFGKKIIDTKLGSRAAMHAYPFFEIGLGAPASENTGDVLMGTIGWTGNYRFTFEVDNAGNLRVISGINPYASAYELKPNEWFVTPEFIFTLSNQGTGKASRDIHDWARNYQIKDGKGDRLTLLNNWESTGFNFNEKKLEELMKEAKHLGVDMFLLDDGWFANKHPRQNDKAGLGDWEVTHDKLPNGIPHLVQVAKDAGVKFGIWIEPEMVSEDSDLYRKHPDWALTVPGRNPVRSRNQLVLDFSRKEVVDCIYDQMEKLLADSKVSYIKWDMNRSITECFSKGWAANKQGEIFHRYILGVYDLYERLTKRFPEILFESCASGGGRFDPGMLYYAPQTWTSDDSDAIERIKIQYGTSMVYPLSSMGAHVSVTPNHQLFRNTPLSTRANVAYFGAFGYELNIAKLSEEEQEEIKKQVEFVKQYRGLIQKGTFYRLLSPFEGNIAAWIVVSEDKKDAIMGYYKILNDVNCPYRRLCLQGLDEKMEYTIEGVDGVYSGRELMKAGMITSDPSAGQVLDGGETCTDFWSKIYLLHGEK